MQYLSYMNTNCNLGNIRIWGTLTSQYFCAKSRVWKVWIVWPRTVWTQCLSLSEFQYIGKHSIDNFVETLAFWEILEYTESTVKLFIIIIIIIRFLTFSLSRSEESQVRNSHGSPKDDNKVQFLDVVWKLESLKDQISNVVQTVSNCGRGMAEISFSEYWINSVDLQQILAVRSQCACRGMRSD